MRLAALILLAAVALEPAGAQIHIPSAPPSSVAAKPATGTVGGERGMVAFQTLAALEKDLDGRLAATGAPDRCVVLSGSRGLYVTGFGVLFTADVDLVNSPSIGLFRTTITPEEKEAVHKRKLAHVALVENTMREVLAAWAQAATFKSMAPADQIVLGIRLMYRPWEDTTGLPGQIIMRTDRQGGNVRMEKQ